MGNAPGYKISLFIFSPLDLAATVLARGHLAALFSPTRPTDCFAIDFPGRGFSQVPLAGPDKTRSYPATHP